MIRLLNLLLHARLLDVHEVCMYDSSTYKTFVLLHERLFDALVHARLFEALLDARLLHFPVL